MTTRRYFFKTSFVAQFEVGLTERLKKFVVTRGGGTVAHVNLTEVTCQLSICWEGTHLGTHAHSGAAVPPQGGGCRKPPNLNFLS